MVGLKRIFVGVEHVDGSNECGKAPYGNSQFVGVKEVVEEAVNEIADESQSGSQNQYLGFLVLAAFVGGQAAIHRYDHQDHDQQRPNEPLFSQRTEILGVGIAAVAGVGADDGLLLRHLEGRINELVSAWPPAENGALVEQPEGRLPAVYALKVGSVG